MAAKFTLLEVTPTAPPKFIYENNETGEQEVRNQAITEDVVGQIPDDGGNDAVGQGSTTFVANEQAAIFTEGNESSAYGTKAIDSRTYTVKDGNPEEVSSGPGVKSLFNKWSLHAYKNTSTGTVDSKNDYKNYNKTVFDAETENVLNPTAKRVVEYCSSRGSSGFSYSFSDFAQTEHYGQISNEYLITLRRFAYPIQDDIMIVKVKRLT